jgi:beta-lactam-binding protein with PASTA domain
MTHRLIIAALTCAGMLMSGCGDGSETPRSLPNVTGMTLSQAEKRLQSTNVSWAFSEKEGPGTTLFDTARGSSGSVNKALADRRVTSQDPKPGYKVISGDVIVLKLRR